jgi:hypothetical protein
METRAPLPAHVAPIWLRLAAVPAAAALVLAGIWVAGGVLTDDFRASLLLTALWFAAVAGGSAVLWRRVPALRAAALVAVGTFVVVGGYLGYTSMRDRTVNEVVAAGPAQLEGLFRSLAHSTEGRARVVGLPGGGRVLALTGFRTDPGPDLFVYLVPGRRGDGGVEGGLRLGRLKGNIGNQQYALPAGLELGGGATAVIWCRAFSVAFGAAELAPA